MDIRKLQRAIVDGLEDVKGQDIVVFNTEHLSPLFERVIVASGTSNRQTKALAASVRKSVRAAGFEVMRTEGEDNGEWIIVDCAAAVVHLMQPAIRQYYLLEEIWGEKPIKIKLNDVVTRLVKASEPMDEDDEPAPKKASGKRSVAGKLDAPVKKVAAKKAAAKKAVAKTPAERSSSTRAPAAKKVAAKKVVAKKAPAKKAAAVPVVPKTLVVKPVVKKVAGKKVAAKKVAAKAPARKAVAGKKVARKAS